MESDVESLDHPVDNAPVRSTVHRGLTIEGYSRAAVQTYWRVPELKIGFDLGAQPWSFMTTPNWFVSHSHLDHIAALPVLVARLRAVARRGARERPTVLEVGDLRIDPAAHRASRGDVELELTSREFALLAFLARHRGDVVSKRQILDAVWDEAFDGDPNIVEVYIRHLRNKIDRPFGRNAIQTVRGSGYRVAADGG